MVTTTPTRPAAETGAPSLEPRREHRERIPARSDEMSGAGHPESTAPAERRRSRTVARIVRILKAVRPSPLRTLLDLHAFGLDDVRHLTIHVVGEHQHLVGAWRAVTEWFAGPVPPATLLGANLLGHFDQLVEIDATIRRHADHGRRAEDGPHAP